MQPDEPSPESDRDAHPRASERRNFFLMAVLTSAAHGKLTAKVRNLSAGGMMVELAEEPDVDIERGERFSTELRNIGRVRGEVAWIEGRRFGVRFDRVIDPELARRPVTAGLGTPDYVKPVLVPGRSLRYVKGL